MRLLLRLVAIGGVAAVVALFALYVYLDRIVGMAIERGATTALGVGTELDSVRLGFMSGGFGLSGLRVANPSGFEEPDFFRLERLDLNLPLPALLDDPIVVPQLALQGIEVSLERSQGRTNYGVILDNLSQLSAGDSAPADPVEADGAAGPGFIIREIVIRDVTARARMAGVGALSIAVPEIRLQDIGSGSEAGIPAEQLIAIVTTAVLEAIAKNGVGLPADLTRELGGQLARLGTVGLELGGSAAEVGKEVQEQLRRGIEETIPGNDELQRGLESLLGGKPPKQP